MPDGKKHCFPGFIYSKQVELFEGKAFAFILLFKVWHLDGNGRNAVITLWLSLFKKSEKIVIAPKQMSEKIQTGFQKNELKK